MLTVDNTTTLYVVQIGQIGTNGIGKFLGVTQKNSDFFFDGIYEAKNVDAIKSVFTTRILPKGDSVYVRGLNGYPIKEWLSASDGTLKIREARGSKIKSLEKLKSSGTGGTKYKVNVFDEGEGSGCIYWYWWEWDYVSMQYYPVSLLYTTGCDVEGGDTPTPPDETLDCTKFTLEQSQIALAGVVFEAELEPPVYTNNGEEEVNSATGKIRQPILIMQKVMKCSFTLAPNILWYSMFYSGVKYKENSDSLAWKFESCSYNTGAQTAGTVPPCFEIVPTFIPSSIVISTDKKNAETIFFCSVVYKISCSLGYQQDTKYISHSLKFGAND